MKSVFKKSLILLCTLSAVFSLSADELDSYNVSLDRVERNFWSAAFDSTIRKVYQENLTKLERSARKIDQFRRENGSGMNYDNNLTRASMLLGKLPGTHSVFKKELKVSGVKMTTFDEIRKKLSKKGNNPRNRTIKESDISLEDYIESLNFIRDENIEILSKRFKSTNLRRHEMDVLSRTAREFYTLIIEARLAAFKLRKNDPLFKRENKSANKRESR